MPRFLSLLRALAASGAACAATPADGRPVATADVIIIGAGISGIAVARQLALEHNITDFLILEARSLVGGRAYQETLTNPTTGHVTYIEKGCNWIQGPNRDNITELARKYNLTTATQDYDNRTWFDGRRGLDPSDINIPPGKFVNISAGGMPDRYGNISAKIEDFVMARQKDTEVDLTARTGLSLNGWRPRTALERLYEWTQVDFTTAQQPEVCSLYNAFGQENYEGSEVPEQLVIDQRGFRHIFVEELKAALDTPSPLGNRLHLDTTVQQIDYSTSSPRIITDKGTFVARKHVVSTLSIGVLQDDRVTWKPELPEWKQEAIYSFAMAVYQKTFLLFDRKFWGDEQFTYYADPEVRGRYPVWQNLNAPGFFNGSAGDGYVLFNTHVDAEAHRVARMTDKDVQDEAMIKLREMYGADIPDPLDIVVPRWDLDPLFMGSYSNWPLGQLEQHHSNLRQPVDGNKVYFTGESNSREMFGYVQGAWEDGKQTAARLAGCLKGTDCPPNDIYREIKTCPQVVALEQRRNAKRASFQ
ncbi:polyamine oxidase [Microdochium nivale]|nr:polyamine oxidase [Microdochium nivale]